ncbi:MAG: PorV/PorQ family protein [Elusimicrobia bacterium]|nr:PorV/PorQ family protein [Elusimicrobiota bacterium]
MKIIALMLATALAPPAQAAFRDKDAATGAGQFLKLGADARSEGMAEAVHAESSDANAVYWNPAGLAGLEYRHATITHGAYYQSVFYDYVAYAQPVPSVLGGSSRERELRTSQLGAFGAALIYMNAGPISEVDNAGNPTGQNFTPQDAAFIAGWGLPLTKNLDVGISGKYITSRVEESAETGAFDLGARLHFLLFTMPYTISAGISNLGGRLRFIKEQELLPTTLTVGNTLRPTKNSVLSFDMVAPRDGDPYPALGAEYRVPVDPGMAFALRVGYQHRTNTNDISGATSLSAGAGATFSRFSVDYAWLPYGALGDTHRFSLSYRF